MYTLKTERDLIAQHYLTVPNCGAENELHSHRFTIEIRLQGPTLNDNGYLVDLTEVNAHLDELVDRYADSTLNELSEFEGRNPSIEHFARILTDSFVSSMDVDSLDTIAVRIWEDDRAWASYSTSL